MHPADIKARIAKAGESQTSIAEAMRGPNGKPITQMAVSHVIYGRSISGRIARRISELVGEPVSTLWPGRYPELEVEQAARRRHKDSAANRTRLARAG